MNVREIMQALRTSITGYEMAAEQLQGVILGQGFVVRCQGVYLEFDLEGTVATIATNPRAARPNLATRFTRSDATHLAASVSNGNQVAGEVVHVRDAIAQEIQGLQQLLEQLQQRTEIDVSRYSFNIN